MQGNIQQKVEVTCTATLIQLGWLSVARSLYTSALQDILGTRNQQYRDAQMIVEI